MLYVLTPVEVMMISSRVVEKLLCDFTFRKR